MGRKAFTKSGKRKTHYGKQREAELKAAKAPKKPMSEEHKEALRLGREKYHREKRLREEEERLKLEQRLEQEAILEATNDVEKRAEFDDSQIVFRPHPGPQTKFLAAPEQEVLYGGAAGGGKTYALIADALRYVGEPDYVGLILRRTSDELREMIQVAKTLYPKMDKGARWSQQKSEWTFSSGARIWMTYLDKDDDVLRYQGQAFGYIAFDELTHWPTQHPWDYMRSRLRVSSDSNVVPCMRATSNPGGPGHAWVKKMFVDPAAPGKSFWATDIETGDIMREPDYNQDNTPNENAGRPLFQRKFIPAKLKDNPSLANTNYLQSLMSLPPEKRRALLDGDWDVAEGAAFPEFKRGLHSIEPYKLDGHYKIFRAADYGYKAPACVLWMAVAPSGQVFVVDELYESGLDAPAFAEAVKQRDRQWDCTYGIIDGSIWSNRGETGPSVGETINRLGGRWRRADRSKGSRTSGKNLVHQYLKVDEFLQEPRLLIFNNCVNLIACMASIPLDKNNHEDVDTDFTMDHAYDALRYGLMSRPKSRHLFDFGETTSNYKDYSRPQTKFGHGY